MVPGPENSRNRELAAQPGKLSTCRVAASRETGRLIFISTKAEAMSVYRAVADWD